MNSRGGALVLVLTSPILRSALVARLGLAGELFQTAGSLESVRLEQGRRAAAMLVIDPAALPAGCALDVCLVDAGWPGRVALLADADVPDLPERFTRIDTTRPIVDIVDSIRTWRTDAP